MKRLRSSKIAKTGRSDIRAAKHFSLFGVVNPPGGEPYNRPTKGMSLERVSPAYVPLNYAIHQQFSFPFSWWCGVWGRGGGGGGINSTLAFYSSEENVIQKRPKGLYTLDSPRASYPCREENKQR